MGLLDNIKGKAEELKDQVGGDKLEQGIDKAGDVVDEKTGGKFGDKIDQGQDFAKDKLGGDAPQQ